MVFHRFLLRTYNMMIKRDTASRQRYLRIYFWLMSGIYFSSQALETGVVCSNYQIVLTDNFWDRCFRWKSIAIITTMLICNTVISIVVLPVLYKQINSKSVTWFAIFMCVIFECIIAFREYIVTQQDHLKEDNQEGFRDVLIIYCTCCELLLYMGIIGEIFHQIFTMRKEVITRLKQSLNLTDGSTDQQTTILSSSNSYSPRRLEQRNQLLAQLNNIKPSYEDYLAPENPDEPRYTLYEEAKLSGRKTGNSRDESGSSSGLLGGQAEY